MNYYIIEKIRKMYVICIMLLILSWSEAQFPQDVYVAEDKEIITDLITRHQLEENPTENAEETRVTLEALMPYPCDDIPNRKSHYLRNFGHVAANVRTFTEVLTTRGRYYTSKSEYDIRCACPSVYKVTWNPARGKHKIFSAQLRQGYVPQETTQIMVENRQIYVIFFENHNVVEYRRSDVMTVVGTEDPRIANQAISNLRRRFLQEVRDHRRLRPVEYKTLAQTSLQSTISRARNNYTNEQGLITSYRYLQVTDLDVMTQLRMIDHMIAILYETYEWVEWQVTAIDASEVDQRWLRINRQEPCQIAEGASWGITYRRGVRGTIRVCDFREYSYMQNASETGFEMIFPKGNFEPEQLSQDFRYELREINSTVIWHLVEGDISQAALIKAHFRHGNVRTRPTSMYSLVSNNVHARFHKNFLLAPWWKLARTQLMIHAQDQMCERTEYTDVVRQLNLNERPKTRTDEYRILKKMNERRSKNCNKINYNLDTCGKHPHSGECYYAVGSSTTAYYRTGIRVDPWRNEANIPQAEVCFLTNVTQKQIASEVINSETLELIGIKSQPELRYELNRRLKTFDQLLFEKWRNKADEMNNAIALIEQGITEMQRVGMTGSHEENLLARYAAMRAVTRAGETNTNWNQKFNNMSQRVNDKLARLRYWELRMYNLELEAQRDIVTYYLFQRIRAMLPHLTVNKANELEMGKIFRIRVKKGEILVKEIATYGRPRMTTSPVIVQTTAEETTPVTMRAETILNETTPYETYKTNTYSSIVRTQYSNNDTNDTTSKTSPYVTNKENENESNEYNKEKEERMKILVKLRNGDENHAIMNLIEEELEGHEIDEKTWKQILNLTKDRTETLTTTTPRRGGQSSPVEALNEHEVLILIIAGTAIGTIGILLLIYNVMDKRRKDKMTKIKKAKQMIKKTKNLPFADRT